jgi:hypothetical protein
MSYGRAIERGSHDASISAGGRYAQGWIAQSHASLRDRDVSAGNLPVAPRTILRGLTPHRI